MVPAVADQPVPHGDRPGVPALVSELAAQLDCGALHVWADSVGTVFGGL
jgi:hypothetical protein